MASVRCDNCGWGNPGGLERCQKCNQPLSQAQEVPVQTVDPVCCVQCGYPKFYSDDVCANCGASGNAYVSQNVSRNQMADSRATRVMDFGCEDFNKTPKLVNGNMAGGSSPELEREVKPEPVNVVQNPNSRATIRDLSALYKDQSELSGNTDEVKVMENDLSGLKLVPMDGYALYGEVNIGRDEGEKILCRENVDSGNPSIDASSQASVSFEDGKWYICNLSSMQNTFVCKRGKVELETGDIVVIGNRRYTVQ